MRINCLKVKNFRGFAERTFEFPRSMDAQPGNGSFHVVIGQNGTGKTSVLEALAVAVGSWFLGVRDADSRHIQPKDVRVSVHQFGDTARIEQQLPVRVEVEGLAMGQTMTWRREFVGGKPNAKSKWVDARRIKEVAEQAVERMQRGEPVTLPLIAYYGAGRLWQETKEKRGAMDATGAATESPVADEVMEDMAEYQAFASRLAGYRYSIDPRCNQKDLLRWLKCEQGLAVQNRHESRQFQIVKAAIQESVEGCSWVGYDLRLGLLLEVEKQGRLPFSALSDGQRNVAAMIGDLAYKAAQLNPHLGLNALKHTPGIVLIDELDLHLHPKWQRHVIEDLRRIFPEIQFIATTHSPFIVQTARPGELVPLDAQALPDVENLGVEEIARGLMNVPRPEVSPRYEEMKAAAKHYLLTLDEAALAPPKQLQLYLDQLAANIAPYADNPAFQAFLELKREAKLGGRQ